jgi:phosphate:Na+ symporter
VVGVDVALGLVLGANLGSGLLAVITTPSPIAVRQVTVGNLLFKLFGVVLAAGRDVPAVRPYVRMTQLVVFHLAFNVVGLGLPF